MYTEKRSKGQTLKSATRTHLPPREEARHRRAYDRARQELKTIELEARPKGDRKPDLHAIEQAQLRRERRADGVGRLNK